MKRTLLLAFGAAAALVITGCQPPASSSANGTVALLDIDAVAKRLGRDAAIVEQLKARNDSLSESLTQERNKLQGELTKSEEALGTSPTDAQKQELLKLGQGLNAQLQSKLQAAREELSAQQTTLIRQFREEVRPVAQKIAAKKGMNIVILRSDIVVLSADAAVDITDDVVAEMIGSGKSAATPAASPTATP
jgi:Skp family chaperone for outer membrane proteins